MDEGFTFDIEDQIKMIIGCDDKHAFVSFLTSPSAKYLSTSNCLKWICKFDAVNCGTALLEGETGQVANVNAPVSWGCYPLHLVASTLSSRLVELFLRHGAQADVILVEDVIEEINGMLPLNIALEAACHDEYLKNWTPRQSIFKLIIILCLPKLKDALDTNKLLASSSKEVGEVAYHYAKEGKLIELAILLMVAREKVLGPITFQSKDAFGLDGRMTLCQCINNEIVSLINEEVKLMGKVKSRKLTRMLKEKMVVMRSMRLLLEVFERAGDAIEEYLQLRQPDVLREQVVEDVVLRLVEASFDLKPANFYLSEIDRDLTKLALEQSEESYRISVIDFALSMQKRMVLNPRKEILDHGHSWSIFTPSQCGNPGLSSVGRSIHTNQVSKSIFGSLYSKNVDVQVKKRTKAMEQYVPKFSSSKKWAYFALVIKRGIRHV